mmetsp:Transcript_64966/g.152877  ORF Transcript_64966/g.152877 Transcript_64966/m.152877 type:complete len:654 (+) Transcript_64966:45-2006(+)
MASSGSTRFQRKNSALTPEAFHGSSEGLPDLPAFELPSPNHDHDDHDTALSSTDPAQPSERARITREDSLEPLTRALRSDRSLGSEGWSQGEERSMSLPMPALRRWRTEKGSGSREFPMDDMFLRSVSDATNTHRRQCVEVFGFSASLSDFQRAVSEGTLPQSCRKDSGQAAFNPDTPMMTLLTEAEPGLPQEDEENKTLVRGGKNDVAKLQEVKYSLSKEGVAAFVLYVIITANDSIVKAWSRGDRDSFPYAVSSVIFTSGVVSLLVGLITTWHQEGPKGWSECCNVGAIFNVACVNIFFQIAAFLKFGALALLPPDVVSMLSQMNLILLAVAIKFVFKKGFTEAQWFYLIMISCGVILYMSCREGQTGFGAAGVFAAANIYLYCFRQESRCERIAQKVMLLLVLVQIPIMCVLYRDREGTGHGQLQSSVPRELALGCTYILLMCCCESLASVCLEHYFKHDEKRRNFSVQKVHVDVTSIVFSMSWYVLQILFLRGRNTDSFSSPGRDGGNTLAGIVADFYAGWDWSTVAVLGMLVSKAWLAGLVAKLLDSVVKQIGSCTAIVLMFFEMNGLYFNQSGNTFVEWLGSAVSILIVLLAIGSFTVSSTSSAHKGSGMKVEREESSTKVAQKESVDANWAGNYPPAAARAERKQT